MKPEAPDGCYVWLLMFESGLVLLRWSYLVDFTHRPIASHSIKEATDALHTIHFGHALALCILTVHHPMEVKEEDQHNFSFSSSHHFTPKENLTGVLCTLSFTDCLPETDAAISLGKQFTHIQEASKHNPMVGQILYYICLSSKS